MYEIDGLGKDPHLLFCMNAAEFCMKVGFGCMKTQITPTLAVIIFSVKMFYP